MNNMKYNIPILLIVFNRLEVAIQTFEAIRNIKPTILYIAQDGARVNVEHENEVVENVRKAILSRIDWDCEVKTLFQDRNLGCGIGVYTAINWFFECVEYGIILEDDCVVNTSFFEFVQEMLLKYKTDTRIGMIAGTNPIPFFDYKYSYLFSKYKSCWGWATWRRAWRNMDINMSWREDITSSVLRNSGFCGKDIAGWKYKLKCIDKEIVSAWDWQWYFSLAAQNQLCIYPAVNLVSNIGNGVDATHTSFGNITFKSFSLDFPLKHPEYVMPYYEFDQKFYRSANSLKTRILRFVPQGIKKWIKKGLFYLKR